MLNAVIESVLADVSSVSPSSEQRDLSTVYSVPAQLVYYILVNYYFREIERFERLRDFPLIISKLHYYSR